ncbi:hypothetical protein HK097_008349 [Rhizophlyctis rosea]|uniref:Uncharacterized protein n=1 Tax=Rhizophlyctis rosea TaxID=64517 RepID=A0AAD5SAC6_9FUNG|nr:hypothetical protein HK097_008349 [Rhizophlyctis rosea]
MSLSLRHVTWGYTAISEFNGPDTSPNLRAIVIDTPDSRQTRASPFRMLVRDTDTALRKWMLKGPLSTLRITVHLHPETPPSYKGDLVMEVRKEQKVNPQPPPVIHTPGFDYSPFVYKTTAIIRPATFPDDYIPRDIKPYKKSRNPLKILGLKGQEKPDDLHSVVVFPAGRSVYELCVLWNRRPQGYANFTGRTVQADGEELVDGEPVWVPPPGYEEPPHYEE